MGTATSTGAPERARWPRLAAPPHPLLRSLLPGGYAGFTEASTPRHLVLPATTSVPVVVKLADSPYRPPSFVMGAHAWYSVVEGDCAPTYLEVMLDPLGALRLLGLPMGELSGQLVDLVEVLGADGRRLGEQLHETTGWRRRFALLDRFLLRRLETGPRPSPEVGRAWGRLNTTGGSVPIGQLAAEVGWSHRHLLARFKRQVGLRRRPGASGPRLPPVQRDHPDRVRGLDASTRWGRAGQFRSRPARRHVLAWPATRQKEERCTDDRGRSGTGSRTGADPAGGGDAGLPVRRR